MRLYAVTRPDAKEDQDTVIVTAYGREQAKRVAHSELPGNPDEYIIEPLPRPSIGQLEPRVVWRTPEAKS